MKVSQFTLIQDRPPYSWSNIFQPRHGIATAQHKDEIYVYYKLLIKNANTLENLKKHILTIADLSEESWTILYDCLTELEFDKGENLLNDGDVCNAVFFISSGFCKSFYIKDGKQINTAFYFENEFATNIKSLTKSIKSEYSIQACENLRAVKFNKARLLQAYERSHEIEAFGRKMLEIILGKQEEHSDIFKLLTPKERYASLLMKRPDFLQRVSLTQTASYLGISRETLSRYRGIR